MIRITLKDFINRSNLNYNNKYIYSLVGDNITTRKKIKVICPIHGEFETLVGSHIKGSGSCPKCLKDKYKNDFLRISKEIHNNKYDYSLVDYKNKGENIIMNFLSDNNIKYIYQKKFEKCKNINYLPFDFYLIDYNLCIEFDGIQHFVPNIRFGGEIEFTKRVINDKIKTDFCKSNNIELLRIKYDENIIEKLKKYISNYGNTIIQKNERSGHVFLRVS